MLGKSFQSLYFFTSLIFLLTLASAGRSIAMAPIHPAGPMTGQVAVAIFFEPKHECPFVAPTRTYRALGNNSNNHSRTIRKNRPPQLAASFVSEFGT
jgi:hypothetical protein